MLIKNFISCASALWVVANLLVGFAVLLPVAIVSWLLPFSVINRGSIFIAEHIYRTAVRVDSFWMQHILGINLVITGKTNTQQTPIIICNHQSWFDIPLVQHVITSNGPITKFLIKREIVWVPIIGWICLVLNFPRLKRGKNKDRGKSDFSVIQKASKTHGNGSGALLIFPEGSRYSETKKVNQKAPYKHLLIPKLGGLKMIKQHVKLGTSIIDITIDYHQKNVNIWNCLHANPRKITITLEHFNLDEISDIDTWLQNRWLEKDKLLTSH